MSQNPHIISLAKAENMTHAYQNDSRFANLTVACRIVKAAYQEVMDQSGCVDIRTYFALNADETLTIVVVGVDENGDDMTGGVLLNKSFDCPVDCSTTSSLMV
jgi:hypothetical protein